jgi:CRISPR system Cascade subunit CasE
VSALFLSRAVLRRDAPVAALAGLLVPDAAGARADAAHRLVWALFADGPDRRRDFLWREEGPGRFIALSTRPPNPLHDIFDLDSQPFEPRLAAGDRLGFALRANPVVARKVEGARRSTHHDVVMNALHPIPRGERAEPRLEKVVEAGRAWLARQGARHGFLPDPAVAVDGYETIRIPRPGQAHLRFGRLDFEGVLTVTDPALFLARLASGFGRARAFGCGLMLIRRAR